MINTTPSQLLAHACACARPGALPFIYRTTAITQDKTFRKEDISIYFNTQPREQPVNITTPRARTRAHKEASPPGAGPTRRPAA
jgi:hypothetical protein